MLACLRDPRPLDIRSDSEYVVKGVHALRSRPDEIFVGDNADLWQLISRELRFRQTAVDVSWVKGHAKPIDVTRGRTTHQDMVGNNSADGLAVQGAASHSVLEELVAKALEFVALGRFLPAVSSAARTSCQHGGVAVA